MPPPPTTLLAQAEAALAATGLAAAAARRAWIADRERLDATAAQLAELAGLLDHQQDTAADLRRRIAAAATTAEGEALLEELDRVAIARHRTAARIQDAELRRADLVASADRHARALAEHEAAWRRAERRLIDVRAADADRQRWREQAQRWAAAPTLAEQAAAHLTGASYTAARAHLETSIPSRLLAAGRARATTLVTASTTRREAIRAATRVLGDVLAPADATVGGDGWAGKVAFAELELGHADERLRSLSIGAPDELRRAGDVLAAVTGLTVSPASRARIAALTAAGEAALTALPELHTQRAEAEIAVATRRHAIAGKEREIREAGEPTPPDLLAELETLQRELDEWRGRRATRASAVVPHQAAVDAWANAVPDEAWQQLAAFDDLTRTLTALAVPDLPQTVLAASAAAETALAQARSLAVAHEERRGELREDLTESVAAVTADRAAHRHRLIAELRGDLP